MGWTGKKLWAHSSHSQLGRTISALPAVLDQTQIWLLLRGSDVNILGISIDQEKLALLTEYALNRVINAGSCAIFRTFSIIWNAKNDSHDVEFRKIPGKKTHSIKIQRRVIDLIWAIMVHLTKMAYRENHSRIANCRKRSRHINNPYLYVWVECNNKCSANSIPPI